MTESRADRLNRLRDAALLARRQSDQIATAWATRQPQHQDYAAVVDAHNFASARWDEYETALRDRTIAQRLEDEHYAVCRDTRHR